ncbi:murein biosynthesis integral membrane protein MurJ [Mycolicibacterium sp. SCSIO 43805]|uniref:murein biosynthesis integral membrane protein MurJ n=1 Tax=Mycolicibacterium sp. SCSIO 43805 TaxID=3378074 RepID=UPI003AB43A69
MTNGRQRSGIGRTSLAASAGTLGSKLIGFGRNVALAAALGTGLVADSYNIANQVPNQIFLLLGGGTIAFVFVPQLMRHARVSVERADEYGSLLLFMGAAFGLIIAATLLGFGAQVIKLMGGTSWNEAQQVLSSQLFIWCVPQIFFLALFAVTSQLMNARGKFSSAAWAPSVNSLVVILVCIPIILMGTVKANDPSSMSDTMIVALGGCTLLGSALQSMLLLIFLKRAHFSLHFRFTIKGLGLRTTATMSLLTLSTVGLFQLSVIVTAALSTQAGASAELLGFSGRGYTAFFYAQTLLLITQAVASASIASVMLVRLSEHYASGAREAASTELNDAILAVGSLLVPAMSIFLCLGPLLTEVLFARGETSSEAAEFIGFILAVLSVGLLPYALHDLLIRPFFAVHNARIPLRSAAIVSSIWILGAFASRVLLPADKVLFGIAGAFSIAYLIDLPLKLRSLNRAVDFRLSRTVVRGLAFALAAGVTASLIIGTGIRYLRTALPHGLMYESALLVLGLLCFLLIYHLFTFRSSASLVRLIRWLKR